MAAEPVFQFRPVSQLMALTRMAPWIMKLSAIDHFLG